MAANPIDSSNANASNAANVAHAANVTDVTLAGQFRRHMPAYVAGTLVLAAFQLAMNRIDWLAKASIDRIFSDHPEDAWKPSVLMLGLAVFAFATRVASRLFVFNAGRNVEYELRALLLARLHRLGTAFYRKMSSGEIMSRSTGDLAQVRLLFGFGVLNVVNVVFAFGSAFQVMVAISGKLTLAAFVTLPLTVLMTRTFSRRMFERTRSTQEALGRLSDSLQTNLAGVRVVRSFALETRELHRFQKVNREYLEASLALARTRGLIMPLLGAASAAGILVFFWYGGTLLLRGPADGGITKGDFFAFQLALGRMTWPVIALGFSLSIVQRGRVSFDRLKEIFDAKPEVTDGPLPAPAESKGAITITGLGFEYDTRKVLDGVSFEVPAGKSVAIVGRTGSGKSTLAMLLARLLPTPRGAVFIDGHDVCDLPVSFVRQTVGYAQQDAFLFSTTVARNIGFSLDDPDAPEAMETVRDAAREAQVLEEALSLPEQFDTVVGERGVQLSGGQKQRVALARALSWGPRILVLDDPLSAVDAKTEAAILQAIERQAKARTVVLITHRVAAAARCDSIVVLDQGRVVERGTHEELLRTQGIYAAFAEEQKMAHELEEIELEPPSLTPSPIGRAEVA
ncbi:ABC transporter ATP-binding protein [Pendulispora albinea]|uniref:ABC transporter ATP-binding protein/permease n=1 Tax=Pendulispora albinea TaxID=2741071 RepID=A0ABZ2LN77_9BACT